jgi:hypothetical protein
MMKLEPTLIATFSHNIIVAGCFGYVQCLVTNRSALACSCGLMLAFALAPCIFHFDSIFFAFDKIDFSYLSFDITLLVARICTASLPKAIAHLAAQSRGCMRGEIFFQEMLLL